MIIIWIEVGFSFSSAFKVQSKNPQNPSTTQLCKKSELFSSFQVSSSSSSVAFTPISISTSFIISSSDLSIILCWISWYRSRCKPKAHIHSFFLLTFSTFSFTERLYFACSCFSHYFLTTQISTKGINIQSLKL